MKITFGWFVVFCSVVFLCVFGFLVGVFLAHILFFK